MSSSKKNIFFKRSRSPVRRAVHPDNSSQIEQVFERYEKMVTDIMKTPPASPKHESEKDVTEDEKESIEEKEPIEEKDHIDEKTIDYNLPIDDDPPEKLIEYQETESPSPVDVSGSDFCSHQNVIKDKNVTICEDCGIELYQEISHEQDWRYYGDQDSRNSCDPGRCQYRKATERGIKKDLEKLGFPPEICELADKLYLEITKGEVKRNTLRKGILFVCTYESYKMLYKTKIPDELQTKIGIDNKTASQGISYYRLRCPREYYEYEDVDAKHYIPEIMKKFHTKPEHVGKVVKLYENIKEACSALHRSNPKSVSKALVYYYLRRKNCNISVEKYGKIVQLSEAIIIRLSSEISRVLGTQNTVSL